MLIVVDVLTVQLPNSGELYSLLVVLMALICVVFVAIAFGQEMIMFCLPREACSSV